jgi:hypothetical protein
VRWFNAIEDFVAEHNTHEENIDEHEDGTGAGLDP